MLAVSEEMKMLICALSVALDLTHDFRGLSYLAQLVMNLLSFNPKYGRVSYFSY